MTTVDKHKAVKRADKRAKRRQRRRLIQKRTPEQLARLKILLSMPPDAVFPTADAANYRGVAISTWDRLRAHGKTPPAIRIDSRSLGYRKRDLDAQLAADTEECTHEMQAELAAGAQRIREAEKRYGTCAEELAAL
jgi:hypothetical protein